MSTLYFYADSFDLTATGTSPLIVGNVVTLTSLEIVGDYIASITAGSVEALFEVQLAGTSGITIGAFRIFGFANVASSWISSFGAATRRAWTPGIPLPVNTGINLVATTLYNTKQVGLSVNLTGSNP